MRRKVKELHPQRRNISHSQSVRRKPVIKWADEVGKRVSSRSRGRA